MPAWRQRTADRPLQNGHAQPSRASSSTPPPPLPPPPQQQQQQQQQPEEHWSSQLAQLPGTAAMQGGATHESWADVTDDVSLPGLSCAASLYYLLAVRLCCALRCILWPSWRALSGT